MESESSLYEALAEAEKHGQQEVNHLDIRFSVNYKRTKETFLQVAEEIRMEKAEQNFDLVRSQNIPQNSES